MVNRNLIAQFGTDADIEAELAGIFEGNDLELWLPADEQNYESNKIVSGKVIEIRGDSVVIDIGYKSEGMVGLEEWREDGGTPPSPGDTVEVLLETLEGDDG